MLYSVPLTIFWRKEFCRLFDEKVFGESCCLVKLVKTSLVSKKDMKGNECQYFVILPPFKEKDKLHFECV